jgi:hypothetical protein
LTSELREERIAARVEDNNSLGVNTRRVSNRIDSLLANAAEVSRAIGYVLQEFSTFVVAAPASCGLDQGGV